MKVLIKYLSIILCAICLAGCCHTNDDPQPNTTPTAVVTTISGMPKDSGHQDGSTAEAQFYYPRGLALDASGNIYVADRYYLRKISEGIVTTGAGDGISGLIDGMPGRLLDLTNVVCSPTGLVYLMDRNVLRAWSSSNGLYTLAGNEELGTLIDGWGDDAAFGSAGGIVINSEGILFIADTDNNAIRMAARQFEHPEVPAELPDGYEVRTFITDIVKPLGLCFDQFGNLYTISENKVLRIDKNKNVSIVAGGDEAGYADGNGTEARFYDPQGITIDTNNNLYISDSYNNMIRKISPAGDVTTFAGRGVQGFADGEGIEAQLYGPTDIKWFNGTLYVTDGYNYCIRKITFEP